MPEIWELQEKPAYGGTVVDAEVHPEDGCSLAIELTPDEGTQYLSYYLSEKAFKRGKASGVDFASDHWPLLIAEYDFPTRLLTTYPIWLRSNQSNYTKKKYGSIKRISFEDQPPMDFQVGFGMFFDLPTGFHRGPFEGFGLDPRIRYIISTFDEVEGAAGLTICNDEEISIDGDEIRLPERIYNNVRRDINRAHDAVVKFANEEKVSYLRNRLLPSVVPNFEPDDFERPTVDLQDTVRSALAMKGNPRSRNSNTAAAVRTVIRQVDKIAQDDPVQLFELSEKIELFSLQLLIENISKELLNRRKEEFWQEYFVRNPFVLKMLFGLPMIMYIDQASVGGIGLKRSGEKYADYLVEAGMLGNLGIVEIKTTETPLLTKEPYRLPSLFGPSTHLSGGVNQLLDQKLRLIKGIAAKKEDDNQPHIQAWSVPCILIIGTLPETHDQKRSFEIYRGSQRDVLIITFDELLAKLKALHEFLSTKPDQAKVDVRIDHDDGCPR